MRRLLVIGMATAALSACGSPADEIGVSPPDPGLLEAGALLYAENCAQCHGADLRGTDQGPSFLSEVYEPGHHGDGAFMLAVMNGVAPHHWQYGPMPPIEGLSPEDVDSIVAFVRDRQQTEGFQPYP